MLKSIVVEPTSCIANPFNSTVKRFDIMCNVVVFGSIAKNNTDIIGEIRPNKEGFKETNTHRAFSPISTQHSVVIYVY